VGLGPRERDISRQWRELLLTAGTVALVAVAVLVVVLLMASRPWRGFDGGPTHEEICGVLLIEGHGRDYDAYCP
jgi:hypothetical protein